MKTLTKIGVVVAATVSSVTIAGATPGTAGAASAAPPASAAPAVAVAVAVAVASDGLAAAAGTAPACVARYVSQASKAIILRNTCKKKMRVKVIIKRGPDSPCFGMGKGSIRAWKWGTPYSGYDKTVVC
ncbi:hypothetical protein [Planobispora longispora]|uniref:Secreted protein n=1 Tax=Planobispora longispora TaxID=28887 RepID=A0A8J3WAK5_9ACTN|nr:hypothetical protein [Planobispora longispora]BFE88202.1 hypothetical protein GCM10020093_108030 [Planobispora longispora]GIH80911.1 hypothetical protein Plo01_73400 [Planobispora longispora]